MVLPTQELESLAERLRLDQLGASAVGGGLAYFAVVAVIVLVLEAKHGTGFARFRSRSFLNDIAYTLFYRGGVYGVLWGAVYNAFESQLRFLQIPGASELPLWIQIAIFWFVGDLIVYWVHRVQHKYPRLWAFHAVHHAPEQLNTLTQNRRHLVERLMNGLCLYLPLLVILGVPTRAWPPIWMAFGMLEALQHAELDWRFGPFYWVVVSPVFHSIHHSADAEHYDRNFGGMFSFWDVLFGTASDDKERPPSYGVHGLDMPEKLTAQFFWPFRTALRSSDREPGNSTPTPVDAEERASHSSGTL